MATAQTNISVSSVLHTLAAGFGRVGSAILKGLENSAKARSRRPQFEMLEAKSDAELAELGIRDRADIARYVFRDMFYC